MQQKKRLVSLDCLKTIAIIAVVLYHLGVLQYGYLGVELFFLISGYNFAKKADSKEFGWKKYIFNLLSKQYPLIITACFVSIVLGFFVFPIYFKTISYNSLASTFLMSNVLPVLRATDYWNTSNIYNPLMHLWYICVLIHSLAFLSICVSLISASAKQKTSRRLIVFYATISTVSLVLCFIPQFPEYCKFYLMPFRLYEICFGCLIYYIKKRNYSIDNRISRFLCIILYCLLVALLIIGINANSNYLNLAVLCICALIIVLGNCEYITGNKTFLYYLTIIGRYSYSIYIWHQVIIAFLVLLVFSEVTSLCIILTLVLTFLATIITVKIQHMWSSSIKLKRIITFILVGTVLILSCLVYKNKGVFYSIPELGLYSKTDNPDKWIDYVDRPYSWNGDFSNDESKIKLLVLGNSFGRDFANILFESDNNNIYEIKYEFCDVTDSLIAEKYKASNADYIFYVMPGWEISDSIIVNGSNASKVYVIGNKTLGGNNCIVWSKRFNDDYYDYSNPLPDGFLQANEDYKKKYGEYYIDMIYPILKNGNQRVFTDEDQFISVDGVHLSEEGAKYYAKMLDLSFIK